MSEVKEYFDKNYHQHAYHNNPTHYEPIVDYIRSYRSKSNDLRILDFGCGDGSFIKSLITAGIKANYFGTDLSHRMIKSTALDPIFATSNFFVSDGFNLPIHEQCMFDVIHLDSVLHHLIDKSWRKSRGLSNRMLEILYGKLKKDGILIIEDIFYDSYIHPSLTSLIIFYGLKLFNKLHFDIGKVLKEYHPGLEVRFLQTGELEVCINQAQNRINLRRNKWKVPFSYKLFMLREFGHSSYIVVKN